MVRYGEQTAVNRIEDTVYAQSELQLNKYVISRQAAGWLAGCWHSHVLLIETLRGLTNTLYDRLAETYLWFNTNETKD